MKVQQNYYNYKEQAAQQQELQTISADEKRMHNQLAFESPLNVYNKNNEEIYFEQSIIDQRSDLSED